MKINKKEIFVIFTVILSFLVNTIFSQSCQEFRDCGFQSMHCKPNYFCYEFDGQKDRLARKDKECYAIQWKCYEMGQICSGDVYETLKHPTFECYRNSGIQSLNDIANCLKKNCKNDQNEKEDDNQDKKGTPEKIDEKDLLQRVYNNIIGKLREFEGFKTKFYVPVKKGKDGKLEVLGHSGATVATGIDIGQRSAADINKLDISDEIKAKLIPYTSKTGQEALDFLNSHPLELNEVEVNELDKAVLIPFIKNLMNAYYSASNVKFSDLPVGSQQVIASVAHQFGSLPRVAPNFWSNVVKQNWEKAIEELENWNGKGKPDDYSKRRTAEAEILKKLIQDIKTKSGKLSLLFLVE
jgi:hypothetical protein